MVRPSVKELIPGPKASADERKLPLPRVAEEHPVRRWLAPRWNEKRLSSSTMSVQQFCWQHWRSRDQERRTRLDRHPVRHSADLRPSLLSPVIAYEPQQWTCHAK